MITVYLIFKCWRWLSRFVSLVDEFVCRNFYFYCGISSIFDDFIVQYCSVSKHSLQHVIDSGHWFVLYVEYLMKLLIFNISQVYLLIFLA